MRTSARPVSCVLRLAAILCLTCLICGCPKYRVASVSFVGAPRTGPAPLAVQFAGAAEIARLAQEDALKFRGPFVGPGGPGLPLFVFLPLLQPPTITAFNWTFGDGQTGSGREIAHTYTAPGCYTVTLEVVLSNGERGSHTEIDYICIPDGANNAPVAVARVDTAPIFVGETVQLNGSGSTDADGDPLTFQWSVASVPAGSGVDTADLSNTAAENPTFVPDVRGDYLLTLVVDDGKPGKIESDPDTVTVTTTNRPPVAVAQLAEDQTGIFVGEPVRLDGRQSSDPDAENLTYAWIFLQRPPGSEAQLIDADTPTPSFIPDLPGSYQVQLTVSDGLGNDSDIVLDLSGDEILDTQNRPPVANAGPDQTVPLSGQQPGKGAAGGSVTITLDGSASSDPDDDPITFAWSFVSVPPDASPVLSEDTAVGPTFDVTIEGEYRLQLVVDDGHPAKVASAPDEVVITVVGPQNLPPVADAGVDQVVNLTQEPNKSIVPGGSATVTLDGSGSFDPNGDPITFAWSFISVPPDASPVLSDDTAVGPTFDVTIEGEYRLQLVVDDGHPGKVASAPDEVVITVVGPQNLPPVADAGPDQTVELVFPDTKGSGLPTAEVVLDGSGSFDPNGDPLTFAWSFVAFPGQIPPLLSDATSVAPTFTVDAPGEYRLQLLVDDGHPAKVESEPDEVSIFAVLPNAPPVADAGPDQLVEFIPGGPNEPVLLDGSASFDANGDTLTFSWALSVRPQGSVATLINANTATASFTPDVAGEYQAELVVDDGQAPKVASPPDVAVITTNSPPVADAGPDQQVSVETPPVFTDEQLRLFSISCDGDVLRVIDPDTAETLGQMAIDLPGGLPGGGTGLAADPLTGDLWTLLGENACFDKGVSQPIQLLVRINPNTGAATIVGLPGNNFRSLAFDADGILYSTTRWNNQDSVAKLGEAGNALYTLDRDTAAATLLTELSPEFTDFSFGQAMAFNLNDSLIYHSTHLFFGKGSDVVFESVNPDTLEITDIPIGNEEFLSPMAMTFNRETGDFFAAVFDFQLFQITPDGQIDVVGDLDHTATGLAFALRPRFFGPEVTLDGSGSSDPDSDPITHGWTLLSKPEVSQVSTESLSDANDVTPSFTPDVRGDYSWRLIVNDDEPVTRASAPDDVVVRYENSAPLADFAIREAPDQGEEKGVIADQFSVGTLLDLDATPSFDPDGDTIEYHWVVEAPEGSSIEPQIFEDQNVGNVVAKLIPDLQGTWTVTLVVDDLQQAENSASDETSITFLATSLD